VYLGQVLITRLSADSSRIQMRAALRDSSGTPVTDVALQEEDQVMVFSRMTFRPERYIAITGAVRAPGRLPWREGMTLRDAVLLAQGLTEDASLREVEIARLPADRASGALATTTRAPIDSTYVFDRDSTGKYLGPPGQSAQARGAPDVVLQPYDNVLVFRQPDWELHRVVTITGQVRYPGRYALLNRNEKLTDVLARAGGLTAVAYADGVRFYRPIEAPRPTPPSGLAGARSRLGIDLPAVLEDSSFRDNLIMTSGDSVDIPEYNPVVRVVGAVGAPTGVSWAPGKNLDDYVRSAGGYSRLADSKRAYVEQPNGQMSSVSRKFLLPDGVPKPEPGAVIYVPERDLTDKKDWAGIVGAVAAVLGSVVTIIVVLSTTN
jgi:protein involved in polysaccharide export with SLBB domain